LHGEIKMLSQKGVTLLELLIALVIIGLVFSATSRFGMDGMSTKKTAQNSANFLREELFNIKNTALSQNTTTRMEITDAAGVYTMTTYYSNAPTSNCSSAGAWTQIKQQEIEVHSTYEITGSAITSTCFFRNGSSSGGSLAFAPVDGASGKSYNFDIIVATGFIDVTEN